VRGGGNEGGGESGWPQKDRGAKGGWGMMEGEWGRSASGQVGRDREW